MILTTVTGFPKSFIYRALSKKPALIPEITVRKSRLVHLAEKEGFEPSRPFRGLHDFQSCALDQLGDFSIADSIFTNKSKTYSVIIITELFTKSSASFQNSEKHLWTAGKQALGMCSGLWYTRVCFKTAKALFWGALFRPALI